MDILALMWDFIDHCVVLQLNRDPVVSTVATSVPTPSPTANGYIELNIVVLTWTYYNWVEFSGIKLNEIQLDETEFNGIALDGI